MPQLMTHDSNPGHYFALPDIHAGEAEAAQCDHVEAWRLPLGTTIEVGEGVSVVLACGDFETFSEADLTDIGAPAYAEHPTTEVATFSYNLKDGQGVRRWNPTLPPPTPLFEHVAAGGLFEAWNSGFEWLIWNIVCVPRYGWPPLPLEACRCAMAKSKRYGLPGALGKAAQALKTSDKDAEGTKVMRLLCKPRKATKSDPRTRLTRENAPDLHARQDAYCDQDTRAEDEAAAVMPDLCPTELQVWLLDQRVNMRGVAVDRETLAGALKILKTAHGVYGAELCVVTQGAVTSVGQVKKLAEWAGLPNAQDETIQAALDGELFELRPDVRRALEIRSLLGSANVKKLPTLDRMLSHDGRLRQAYQYSGAGQTTRWSSGGVQLQNMTAKGPKPFLCSSCNKHFGKTTDADACPRCGCAFYDTLDEWAAPAMRDAKADVRTGDLRHVEAVWGDAIGVLGGILRSLFVPAPGCDFICVDFSAIEAVVLACLSRCQWRIDVFATHGLIYEQSAANATGIPFEEIVEHKKRTGSSHPARKTVGKVRELAAGYGGWVGAFLNFGAGDFMTEAEIKADVLKWRAESPEIVEFWGGQYRETYPGSWDFVPELFGLEGAAVAAILYPGFEYRCNDLALFVKHDILHMRLPSGRCLYYHHPTLEPTIDKRARKPSYKILFWGTLEGKSRAFAQKETYGGRLAENATQAVARDVQAEAMLRVDAAGYPIVMHTHDELVAEVLEGTGSIDHMTEIMCQRPSWAEWWPIRGAGWRDDMYQKD